MNTHCCNGERSTNQPRVQHFELQSGMFEVILAKHQLLNSVLPSWSCKRQDLHLGLTKHQDSQLGLTKHQGSSTRSCQASIPHLGLAKFPGNVPQKTLCNDNGLSVSFTRAPTWCKGRRQAETRTSFKETKPSVPTGHAFVLESLLQKQTQTTTFLYRSFDGTRLTLGGDGP